ncbi:14324_t:CDS:1, partial [Dentiscutata heterogama]
HVQEKAWKHYMNNAISVPIPNTEVKHKNTLYEEKGLLLVLFEKQGSASTK